MRTAGRENVAYKHYEERFPVKQGQKRDLHVAPTPRRRKKARVKPGLLGGIAVVVIAAVFILYCQMQLTQLSAQVGEQNDLLNELTAENVSLTTKQMNSVNLDEVEEYAVNTLGMVKMDNSQIEYVELTNEDTVTVADSGMSLGSLFAGLARSFSAIVEYIR